MKFEYFLPELLASIHWTCSDIISQNTILLQYYKTAANWCNYLSRVIIIITYQTSHELKTSNIEFLKIEGRCIYQNAQLFPSYIISCSWKEAKHQFFIDRSLQFSALPTDSKHDKETKCLVILIPEANFSQ